MARRGCPGCRQRDARIAALEARVRELEARLNQNASNSSVPPSQNPPQAPKPVVKPPTGRAPGGQPGHPGPARCRVPPERLQEVIAYVPTHCTRCRRPLPAEAGPDDPSPTWHQVAELPEALVAVTEYQGHGRRCPGCGAITWAAIPAAVKAHGPGPRLATFLAYLSGRHHLSKRSVAELVTTVFQVPLAVGTVTKVERAMSQALAPAHAEVQQAVRAAPVKQVDETSWKLAGQLHWLWVAATTTLACFVIHVRRGAAGLTALLGEAIAGIVGSDRWSVYNRLPVAGRQICWAHLKRDFQKCVDRGGPAARLGADGLSVVALLFDAWHLFQAGRLDRGGLQAELAPLRRELQYVLTVGSRCRDGKAATFCQNLLAVYPALWTFAAVEGVEPTNNQAERVLRRGVLWRKQAYGCHSVAGCRFVERMLTVVQTLRLQQRAVWDYLYQALVAHRAGLAAPKLLSEG